MLFRKVWGPAQQCLVMTSLYTERQESKQIMNLKVEMTG